VTERTPRERRTGGQAGARGGPPERPGSPHDQDLDALRRRLVEFAAARHWQPFHTPKNLAAALSVEASELLEIFQWLTPEQAAAVMDDEESAHRVRDEVADVLAYLLQFCEVLGIDLLAALAAKIDRNEQRFPRPEGGSHPSG
jgi:NTP pyrophosphatase (non-canonical NTP hydrolase)